MTCSKAFVVVGFAVAIGLASTPAYAQRRGGGGHGGGGAAVSRGHVGGGVVGGGYGVAGPRIGSPRVIGVVPYRPYFHYRPGFSIGFYGGWGYPYYYGYAYPYPYYYPYAYSYPYPYSYPAYSYPTYSAPAQQPYQQQPYQQQPYQGASVTAQQAPAAYGGVRIQGAPHDAQIYVDGYYAGIADDFDGDTKHLNLTSGPHEVEIRIKGEQPVAFDVNVPPNQTVTVRVP